MFILSATALLVLFGGIASEQFQAWLLSNRVSALLLTSISPPVSTLIITKGGTYSGNWESLDANVPAVTIKTSEPVVIENSRLRGRGHLIQNAAAYAKVTVRNTYDYGLNPNVYGRVPGRFLQIDHPQEIVVENCYMESTSSIYIYGVRGDGSPAKSLKIRYKKARNIDGRKSDGNGGFIAEFGWSQFVQLNQVRNVAGIEIAWNEAINEPYNSRVEDNINIHLSSGTSSNPIRIHNNYIQGAYPANLAKDAYSGGGILIGDGSATNASDATAFVNAYNNQVVSTTNYGMAIAAGHNNEIYNNRIISSGLLPDGTRPAAQNVGVYVWDLYGNKSRSTFYNNSALNNTIGWVKADGGRNDMWFPSCASDKCNNNTVLPNPIVLDTEKIEFQIWQKKLAINKILISPK